MMPPALQMPLSKTQWSIFSGTFATKAAELAAGIRRVVESGGTQDLSKTTNDLFISWAHKDTDVKDRLYPALMEASYSVWIDAQQLAAGHAWRTEIANGVLGAKLFIFCLSKASCSSQYCNEECMLA